LKSHPKQANLSFSDALETKETATFQKGPEVSEPATNSSALSNAEKLDSNMLVSNGEVNASAEMTTVSMVKPRVAIARRAAEILEAGSNVSSILLLTKLYWFNNTRK
jgi:hypothetical protein